MKPPLAESRQRVCTGICRTVIVIVADSKKANRELAGPLLPTSSSVNCKDTRQFGYLSGT